MRKNWIDCTATSQKFYLSIKSKLYQHLGLGHQLFTARFTYKVLKPSRNKKQKYLKISKFFTQSCRMFINSLLWCSCGIIWNSENAAHLSLSLKHVNKIHFFFTYWRNPWFLENYFENRLKINAISLLLSQCQTKINLKK